jgi:hypothetical protein
MMKKSYDFSLTDFISDNRELCLSLICYLSGLILGAVFFRFAKADAFGELFIPGQDGFITLFINRLCLYSVLFFVTVLAGLSIIGFPFVNIIPVVCGIEIALKLSYFYVSFSAKGFGYALLLVIPQACALMTVLIYTIKLSGKLSKQIFSSVTKNAGILKEISLKEYLQLYLFYFALVSLIATLNALLTYALAPIINL